MEERSVCVKGGLHLAQQHTSVSGGGGGGDKYRGLSQLYRILYPPLKCYIFFFTLYSPSPCSPGNNTRSYYDDILDCCLPLALPSLLSAAYSGIFLIPNLEVQYLAFMILTFFRVFFFGTGPVIIASM